MPVERDFAQLGMGQALWEDYDGDADLDILMIGSETPFKRPRLVAYRNEGGRFAIEFEVEGLVFASMVAGDYNADGDLDLFAMGQTVEGEPRLLIYINQIFPEIILQ